MNLSEPDDLENVWFLKFIEDLSVLDSKHSAPAAIAKTRVRKPPAQPATCWSPKKDNSYELLTELLESWVNKLLAARVTPRAISRMMGIPDYSDIPRLKAELALGKGEACVCAAKFYKNYKKWIEYNK